MNLLFLPSRARGGATSFMYNFASASLPSGVTFARASSGTRFNASGVMVSEAANVPRFDYDPVSLALRGLLVEERRTNLFLQSAAPATQSITVSASTYTLSFYGIGNIILSGAYSATITGNAAFPTRSTLTFTPSAGTLTLTVNGSISYPQLEGGSFATSYIPTTSSAKTRASDIISITNTSWLNASQGAFVIDTIPIKHTTGSDGSYLVSIEEYTGSTNVISCKMENWRTSLQGQMRFSGVTYGSNTVDVSPFERVKFGLSYKSTSSKVYTNGIDTTGSTLPSLVVGGDYKVVKLARSVATANLYNGWILSFSYYNTAISSAQLQALTQ